MIFYDSGDWTLLSIWRYRGSVLPQAASWALTSVAIEAALRHSGLLDNYLYKYIDDTRDASSLSFVWWGFTAILSVFIGVRCNTSYQRFWEGAQLVYLVRGEWFNCVSSLLSFCTEDPLMIDEVQHFQQVLVRIASLLHCMALQHVCDVAEDSLEILDMEGFDDDSLEYLDTVHDRCDVLVQWLQRLIMQSSRKKVLDAAPPILTRSFQELSRGIVNLNNVRRIKDIPFPYPYHQTTLMIMILHWFLTPIVACMYVQSAVLASCFIFIGQTGLWSVIFISAEMDQPFGEDPNDLPMAEMQRDFNRSLLSLLHPMSQRVPCYRAVAEKEEFADELVPARRNSSTKGRHQTLKLEQLVGPLSPQSPPSPSAVSLTQELLEHSVRREEEAVKFHDATELDDASGELASQHGRDDGGGKQSDQTMGGMLELMRDYTVSPSSTPDDIGLDPIPESRSTGPNLAQIVPESSRDAPALSGNATTSPSDTDDELADLEVAAQKPQDLSFPRQTSAASQLSMGSNADIRFTTNPLRHKARRLRSPSGEDPSSLTARPVQRAAITPKPRRLSLTSKTRKLSAA
eukprot:TRINITY_DN44342_c0_g1_i1.p1 TRINITY_DN44342_c0_g1~~TRINITY_DN44342_c0_g1_i1.p1  ORF type:complete len:573 (+),score=64.87 TRINITY_DN44342_c0_g1_i1:76-1794(+)